MENINSGDTAWLLASASLVMPMRGPWILSTAAWSAEERPRDDLHSFFILCLISVQGSSGDTRSPWTGHRRRDRRPRMARGSAASAWSQRRLRGDRCASGVHGVQDDVRGDHAGAHHRRVRRAQAFQGVRRLHPSVGTPSTTGRALGLGCRRLAPPLGALDFAGGTWCTSPAACRPSSRRGARSRRGLGSEAIEPPRPRR